MTNAPIGPAPAWHLLRTRPQGERRAVAALTGQGFSAFSPMMRTADGIAPLWRGYAFANWITEDAYAWHRVNDALGGGWIVMANGSEAPEVVRPRGLVDAWIAVAGDDMIVPGLAPAYDAEDWSFLIGRTVRLPVQDLYGRVIRIERDRPYAIMHVEMFGRPMQVPIAAAMLLVVGDEDWMPRYAFPARRKRGRRRGRYLAKGVNAAAG